MRYQTSSGGFITAATATAAAALAAQYGMGEIVGAVAAAPKPAKPMTLAQARRLATAANEWPRCFQGWPTGKREEEADAILRAAIKAGWRP